MRIAVLTSQQRADLAHAGWCAARAGGWAGDCPHPWGSPERDAWLDGFRTFLVARAGASGRLAGGESDAPTKDSRAEPAGDLADIADLVGAFA